MDVLKWLPSAVVFITLLAAAAIYLRGSRDKGTIDTLERNNAALTERVTILEADQKNDRIKLAAQTQTIEVLTNTVNSSELIQALSTSLQQHHTAAMEGMEQIHSDLAGLPVLLASAMKGKP